MKRSRINPMSKKRRASAPLRRGVVQAVHARDIVCQAPARLEALDAKWRTPCGGPLDVHEVIPRSVWPNGHLIETNCVLICRRHHEWVGEQPELAAAIGLHDFSWNRPKGMVS